MARRSRRRRARALEEVDTRSDVAGTEVGGGEDAAGPAPSRPGPARAAARGATPGSGGSRGRVAAFGRAMLRPSRHQLVLAVVLGLVAMGVVVQLRAQNADDTYSTARRADLIQLLDGLSAETRRLEDEQSTLEQTRRELESGADSERVAREQAAARSRELSVLAGTAPAEGPGVRLRIFDPEDQVDPQVLLNAVGELRDAGAEVIELDDSIRVGAATWFGTGQEGLLADGRPLGSTIMIEAIGDPRSLEEAVRFRGGLVSEITGPQVGGQVSVEQIDLLVVDSVREPPAFQYAEPQQAPR